MADNDKMWFELGVRDMVSRTLEDILQKAEDLQDRMSAINIGKDAIKNAQDIEQALDKIAVAKSRIAETRLLTKDREDANFLKRMDKELTKIQKKFEKFAKGDTDVSKAMMGTKGMSEYLKMQVNLGLAIDQVRRKTGEMTAAAIERERSEAREAHRLDVLKDKYYELSRARTSLQDALMNAAPGTDTTQAKSLLSSLTARIGAVTRAQDRGNIPLSVQGAEYDEFLRKTREQTRSLSVATDDYNKKLASTESLQRSLTRMKLDAESQQRIAQIRKQNVEYAALGTKIAKLTSLLNQLQAEQSKLKSGVLKAPTLTSEVVNERLDSIQRRYNEDIAKGKQLEREDADLKSKKVGAIQMLSHANQSLIASYNRIAEAGSKANRITIQLQNQMAGYAGLYGIERIVKSIITIGGQFEYQHIALQNILGDVQQANTLFAQLQELAVESPKTFMELTNYTKQLSAYQIPYEELYDTTKRLADISSGLGVDMSRLILAYGQVRSASVLRGQELRQFTEAGIPLVQKLAEKFTELNGKLVTTGDVFGLISKRAVPFKMIQEILWDMTNEGGQFYNMQAELADTLYGKWQKLQDQWQITLGHIADGEAMSGKLLKGLLEGLVKVAAAFDKIIPVLGMFFSYKLFKGGVNYIRGIWEKQAGIINQKNLLNAKEQLAIRLEKERLLTGRKLEKEERAIVRYKNELKSQDYYLLAIEKQISEQKAYQLMLEGKLNKTHFRRYLQLQGYSTEQRKQIMAGDRTLLKKEEAPIGNAMKGAWNYIGGWWGVAMSAIGGAISLYNRFDEQIKSGEEAAKSQAQGLMSSFKQINDIYTDISNKQPSTAEDMTSSVERMTNAIKSAGMYNEELDKQVNSASSLSEKYKILYSVMEDIASQYLIMKENAEAYLAAANNVGATLFTDSMKTNLEQWSRANVSKRAAKRMADEYGAQLKLSFKAFMQDNNIWQESFETLDWSALFDKIQKYQKENAAKFITEDDVFAYIPSNSKAFSSLERYTETLEELRNKQEDVFKQVPETAEYYAVLLTDTFKTWNLDLSDIINWDEDNVRKFKKEVNDIIATLSLDKESADKFRDAIISEIFKGDKKVIAKINAVPLIETKELSDWQEEVQQYFKEHDIKIPITADITRESLFKKMFDVKKEAQAELDRTGPILLSMGISGITTPWGQAAKVDNEEAQKIIDSINEAIKHFNATETGGTRRSGGGSKTDEQLKKWREEWNELKSFYSEFKKWAKEFGEDEAIKQLRETGIWGQFFNADGALKYNIRSWDEAIKAFRSQLKGGTTERDKFIFDVDKEQLTPKFDTAKEAADAILKQLEEALKERGKQWDLYKKILDATGNKQQASQIAFGSLISFDNYAEQLRKELEGAIKSNQKTKDMTIEQLLGMNDEALRKLDVFKENTNGVYVKLQRLKDEMQSVKSEEVELFIEALKNAKSLETELDLITNKYQRTREAIKKQYVDENGNITPEGQKLIENTDTNEARDKANKQWEWFKNNTKGWGEMFSNLDRTTSAAIDNMINKLEQMLPSIQADEKSVKELYDALEKLRNQRIERNPFVGMFSSVVQASRLRGLIGSGYFDSINGRTFTPNAQQAKYYGLNVGQNYSKDDLAKLLSGKEADLSKFIDAIGQKFKALQDVLQPVIDLFEALGDTTLSDIFKTGSNALGAAAGVAGGMNQIKGLFKEGSGISNFLGAAGPYAAIAGAGLSIVSSLFAMHDAALQEEIEASQQRQKEMENLTKNMEKVLERTLGGVYSFGAGKEVLGSLKKEITGMDFLGRTYYKGYIGKDTIEAVKRAEQTAAYYDAAYASLLAQRDELKHQMESEEDKKDSDSSKIADYKQQITEIEDEAKNFALDMAKSLYDIDIKSWAQELTDAIVEAWDNGEDAAEAYATKVKSLMKDLTKNILAQKVLEQAFKNAGLDDLIAKLMDEQSGKLNYDAIPMIADALSSAGENAVSAVTAVLDEMEKKGYIDKGDGSSSTASKIIQGGFNENETGLLLSYVNTIRADVSVQRVDVNYIRLSVEQMSQRQNVIAAAQTEQMRQISENTKRNADAADSIYKLLQMATRDKSFGFKIQ